MRVFTESYELWLVAFYYLLSTSLAIVLSVLFYSFNKKSLPFKWDGSISRKIMRTAPGLAASSFIEYLTIYAPRILLGLMGGSSSITFLFVATSTANIFILPVTMGASLLLTLLAGKNIFFSSLRARLVYLFFVIFLSFIVYGVSYFVGLVFIDYLYPNLSQQLYEIYKWIAFSNLFFTISLLIRSVLIRYSSLRVIIMLPTYGMVIMLLALVLLIPVYGVMGAVMAIVVTAALSSILSIIYYMRYCYSLSSEESLGVVS
jgi:O-antigen/teichoic acid export membrane protein